MLDWALESVLVRDGDTSGWSKLCRSLSSSFIGDGVPDRIDGSALGGAGGVRGNFQLVKSLLTSGSSPSSDESGSSIPQSSGTWVEWLSSDDPGGIGELGRVGRLTGLGLRSWNGSFGRNPGDSTVGPDEKDESVADGWVLCSTSGLDRRRRRVVCQREGDMRAEQQK